MLWQVPTVHYGIIKTERSTWIFAMGAVYTHVVMITNQQFCCYEIWSANGLTKSTLMGWWAYFFRLITIRF